MDLADLRLAQASDHLPGPSDAAAEDSAWQTKYNHPYVDGIEDVY